MTAASLAAGPDDAGATGRTLLWLAAALVVTALHGGTLAAMLARSTVPPPVAPAPAAVMIDLAPIPSAPPAPETLLNPDPVSPPDFDTTLPDPEPPAPPEPVAPPEPMMTTEAPSIPDNPVPAPEPEPVLDLPPPPDLLPPDLPPPPEAVAPRPRTRVPDPPEEEAVRQPRPEAKEADKRPAVTPAVAPSQVRAATTGAAAAPETTSGNRSLSPATWQARLMARLEKMKRYPPGARKRQEEGTAQVQFAIDARGNVLSVRLVRSSGFDDLDTAALDLVRRASPVPAPPAGAPRDITAPIRFDVR